MLPALSNKTDFYKHYWNYYLSIERSFLATEPYIAINQKNFNAFSVEFIKLYQIICSEIDVTAKCLCSVIGTPPSSNAGINKWKPLILAHFPEFSQQEITVISYDISLKPWDSWLLESERNPVWWTRYNKVKHDRTTLNSSSKTPYYEYANQGNVLNALGALFSIEMHICREIALATDPLRDIIPDEQSKLFRMNGTEWKSDVVRGSEMCYTPISPHD